MSQDLEKVRGRCERFELLYQVSQVLHSTLEPQEALQLILREAVRLTRASSGSVVLINPKTQFLEIHAAHGLPSHASDLKLKVGEGITGWVARTGKPARVAEVSADPRYIMVQSSVQSELAVPLEVNGELRGVLNVDSSQRAAFTEEDQALLEELAVLAARAIHNTWLYEQLRLKTRLLEALISVGQAINSALDLDEALQVITREACLLMGGKMCSLLLLDEKRDWLDLRSSYGAGASYIAKPRLSVAESLVGIVVRRGKPIQVENVQTSNRYQRVDVARQEGLVSLLSVPLVYQADPIGVLSVYTSELHAFSNEEVRTLSMLAELSAIAIERARLYQRVVDLEEHLRRSEQLSAVGLLAAEVAHEIRNPLAVMKMMFHSLDLQFPSGDPRARDAQVMREKMDHLNRIVEQILDFSRGSEPRPGPVNVNQLLEELLLLVRHKLHQHGIKVALQLEPLVPLLMADSSQLAQAFLNLTLNAVEAMPDGGELTIRTRTVRLSRGSQRMTHLAVVISDTGCGMTPEQRNRAFTSLLGTTKPRGTGLGLMIVARVVEAHRGKVSIASRPGKGTTFTVVLPIGG